jgi:hypothetical protein
MAKLWIYPTIGDEPFLARRHKDILWYRISGVRSDEDDINFITVETLFLRNK